VGATQASGGWKLRVFVLATVVASVAASVTIPRLNRPAPLFQPKSFSLAVPEGWRRCFTDFHGFTIAFPDDWTLGNREASIACQYADPTPFVLDHGEPPSRNTALRVMPHAYAPGAGIYRAFEAYNYPDTLKALIDPKRWDVRRNETVRVDGLPTRLIESIATSKGYYQQGTVLYAYLVAAGARHDKRCARFFVHCHPFIVSTRVPPAQRDDLEELKAVVDTAAESLHFYPLHWGRSRHEYLALECFLDSQVPAEGVASQRCGTNGFERTLDEDGREPLLRFTIRSLFESEQGRRRFIVRTYRGDVTSDRYSDDVFTLISDRREHPLDETADLKWRVTGWEKGPEVSIHRTSDVTVFLPARDACTGGRRGLYDPKRGALSKIFDPEALVVIARPVPNEDILPVEAVRELLMGPSPTERVREPRASGISPEGVRVSGGWIEDGRATVGFGEEFAETDCLRLITDLALSRTLRQFPEVRGINWSQTTSN
jgi:hypothetical protein